MTLFICLGGWLRVIGNSTVCMKDQCGELFFLVSLHFLLIMISCHNLIFFNKKIVLSIISFLSILPSLFCPTVSFLALWQAVGKEGFGVGEQSWSKEWALSPAKLRSRQTQRAKQWLCLV